MSIKSLMGAGASALLAVEIMESAAGAATKESIGLGNVDDTSDLNKPVSTATQAALAVVAAQSVPRVELESDSGSELIGFLADETGSSRTVKDKLTDSVSAKDFGAIGDGSLHPVSELIAPSPGYKFETLADLQAVYPFVTSASDSVDWMGLQALFNYLSEFGGVGLLNSGEFVINKTVNVANPAKGFSVSGSGKTTKILMRASTALVAIAMIAPHDGDIGNFTIDCGQSITGFSSHGISISNANQFEVTKLNVIDYQLSAGLMFVTAPDMSDSVFFRDCTADGYNTGRNGWLLEGCNNSAIVDCHSKNLNMASTPGIGLQLKNNCKNSYILGGSAQSCVAGLGFGGDGDLTGTGPIGCFSLGVIVRDCLDGAIVGKTTDCVVEVIAQMANSPAPSGTSGYALNIAGFNVGLSSNVSVYNVQAGRNAIRVSSSGVKVKVDIAKGYGDKLFVIAAGVQNSELLVDTIVGAGNTTNIVDLVSDLSGQTSNRISWNRDLPVGGLANSSILRFPTAGNIGNWISYGGVSQAFNFRTAGVDRFLMSPTAFRPVANNSIALGGSSNIWSEGHIKKASFYPVSSDAPTVNGEMGFTLVSNTSLQIKVRGSDGVTRSVTLTLA